MKKILVVEDDTSISEELKNLLENSGYNGVIRNKKRKSRFNITWYKYTKIKWRNVITKNKKRK